MHINEKQKKRERERDKQGEIEKGRRITCVFNFQAICLNVEDRYVSPLRDRYRA